MILKLNNITVAKSPSTYLVTTMDLDDGDSTKRTANGDLIRDRIAVKKKIELSWAILTTAQISSILQSIQDVFFPVYYLDPVVGDYVTKTFYVGDRPAGIAIVKSGGALWQDLKITLIEQ